jgi:sulfide:quinone oxidoreductase
MHIIQLDALTFVGPQILASDIKDLVRHDIRKIIVTRPERETNDQPALVEITRAATAVGIEVHQIPVVAGCITDDDVSAFGEIAALTSGPVFAYCRSGLRVTSLWALHQARTGRSADHIIHAAQVAGYDISALSARLVAGAAPTVDRT